MAVRSRRRQLAAALRRGPGRRRGRRRRGPATGRGSRSSWESSGRRAVGVEDDAERLAGVRRCARSAAGRRRGRCRCRRRSRRIRRASGGPARGSARRRSRASRPAAVAVRPSSDIASFRMTRGRPVRACLRKGWLSRRAAVAIGAGREDDLDSAVAQDVAGPGPAAFSLGSSEAITTRAIPASRIASDAGRLAALVGARLERHVHRRPAPDPHLPLARSRPAPPARRAAHPARRGSPRR